ncbi:Protein kinase domain,Protein kinase-like domain,Protein kinase, ATP binding site,Serine/threonine- [Cinara cedri]|uniref:Protein kinase domain,Protein kinase-like domain,Protein kinase, ATP binding site,Serine/threonine n=1 Tax=Cinara cedri TaxID=506608 RepID=A0A5E4N5A9_9HEMI|nr:Protein kinase domain,Protein kinase-like domain,Protein kinase, ATP binding site,Serine/threonine- [Cinara cedri]
MADDGIENFKAEKGNNKANKPDKSDKPEKSDKPDKSEKPEKSDKSNKEQKKQQKLSVLETHGYTVGRSVGSGSYATVKIAYSERHKSNVAIKIVSKLQEASDYLEKFLPREIEVVKGLKHENLIKYYQAIETTHRVYIIMEYAENGSLLDIIKRDNHIEEERCRRWFLELVSAVEYCHQNGVVHRDIKCENLLMDTNYSIKLSDFGFARNNMLKKNGQMKTSTTFCGSYAYASPEILKGIPYQPNASDIWSIGVVLFGMLYGTLPFDDTTYQRLLKQVQKDVVFPKDDKVSESSKKLITRLLAPLNVRLKISDIKKDPWCQVQEASANDNKKDVAGKKPQDKNIKEPKEQKK